MKPSKQMKIWIAAMKRQGADIATLTISQYKWHLMLMGGGRCVE